MCVCTWSCARLLQYCESLFLFSHKYRQTQCWHTFLWVGQLLCVYVFSPLLTLLPAALDKKLNVCTLDFKIRHFKQFKKERAPGIQRGAEGQVAPIGTARDWRQRNGQQVRVVSVVVGVSGEKWILSMSSRCKHRKSGWNPVWLQLSQFKHWLYITPHGKLLHFVAGAFHVNVFDFSDVCRQII